MECPTLISNALWEIDLACKQYLEGNGYAFKILEMYNSLQNATLQLALISYARKSGNEVIVYSTLTALDINEMVLERVLNRRLLPGSVLLHWLCQSQSNLSTDAQLSIIAHCKPISFTDLNELIHCGISYQVLTLALKKVQLSLEEFRSILHHLQQKGYDDYGAVMDLILASEYSKTLVRYLQQLVTMDDYQALSVMVLVCASDDQVLRSSRASNRSALLRVLSNWNESSGSSFDNNSIKVSTLQKILSTWSQIDCHHWDVILDMIASLVKQADNRDLLKMSIQLCIHNDLPGRKLINILIESDYQDFDAQGQQLEWLLLKQFTCIDFLHPAWVNLEVVVRYLCKLFIQLLSKDAQQKNLVLIQDCIKTVTIRMKNESGAPVEVLSDLVLQCSQLSVSSFEQCLSLLTQLQLSQADYYEVLKPILTQINEQSDKVSALFRFAPDEVKMQMLQFNDPSLQQAYLANGQNMTVDLLLLSLQQNNHQHISIIFKSVLDLNEFGVISEALKHLLIYAVTNDEQLQNDYWIGIVAGCCDYIINDRVSKLLDVQSQQKDELLRQIIEFLLVMTNLILPKQVSENILIAFRQCLGNQNVSPLCIHGLSVMIYTMSISLKKNLQSILFKLSQIMSSAWTSVHMLEFLNILCSYPDLYGHFTENDYRLVLGIAVKFIEYYQSQAQKRKSVDLQQSAQALDKSVRDDVFAEYVLVLAYTVIRSWIPRVPDHLRDSVYRFTILALSNISQSSELVLNKEKIDVCLQMLQQRQQIYGELHQQSAHDQKDTVDRKLYSDGMQLISLSLLKNSSLKVEIRTSYSYQTRYLKYLELLENKIADYNLVSVETIAQLNLEKLSAMIPFDKQADLPLNETVDRMVSVLDRMFYNDAHKIAVLYVGPDQSDQQEILANSYGSVHYNEFLNNLGDWSFLKDAKSNNIFSGGLDTSEDQLDGKFVITYIDNVQQCVFHVATLMPTNIEADPQLVSKKRHIGNDFVRIVWDQSGTNKFDLDTVSGQFNFVNIIIRPTNKSGCFKVLLQKRSDMPAFSPLCEEKIFTELPDLVSFVRHIAIQANIFAQVCLQLLGVGLSRNSNNNKRLEYIDSRVERLRQIRRIINNSGNQ
ncbi:hypothetical protein MP228_007307 [Amoeboaphelidium protococcarum]|nr:hypothetical protein MP228_007307 [Amoeboaphelidium protococcarum]